MPRRYFKTLENSHEYLFSEHIEANIVQRLPNVDELTDEEHFIDDSTAIDEVIEIAGIAEINVPEQLLEGEHEQILSAKKKRKIPKNGQR